MYCRVISWSIDWNALQMIQTCKCSHEICNRARGFVSINSRLELSYIYLVFFLEWEKKRENSFCPQAFVVITIRVFIRYVTALHIDWLVYSCCSHLEHRASVKRFVSLQFLRQSVGLLGWVMSPSHGRYITQTQNKHRDPCLEWDSNTRSQLSSERKQFLPYTARPLWSALFTLGFRNQYLPYTVWSIELYEEHLPRTLYPKFT
jgi:hypothetical protein